MPYPVAIGNQVVQVPDWVYQQYYGLSAGYKGYLAARDWLYNAQAAMGVARNSMGPQGSTGNVVNPQTGLYSRAPTLNQQSQNPGYTQEQISADAREAIAQRKAFFNPITNPGNVRSNVAALVAERKAFFANPEPQQRIQPALSAYNPVDIVNQTVKRFYTPEGSYAQQELTNIKLGVSESGELAYYERLGKNEAGQQRMAVNPDTGRLEPFTLFGGAGRNAGQSGMFGFAAATPAVFGRGEVQRGAEGLITPTVAAPQLAESKLTGEEVLRIVEGGNAGQYDIRDYLSRLGAEAYGGVVGFVDARTLGNVTYEDRGNRAAWNMAAYLDPFAVNRGKADLPGARIPWSVGEGTPGIFFMTKDTTSGETSPAFSVSSAMPIYLPQYGVRSDFTGVSQPPQAPTLTLTGRSISYGDIMPVKGTENLGKSGRLVGSGTVAGCAKTQDALNTMYQNTTAPAAKASAPSAPAVQTEPIIQTKTTETLRPSDIDLKITEIFGGGPLVAGLIGISDFWLGGRSMIKTKETTKIEPPEYATSWDESTRMFNVTASQKGSVNVSATATPIASGFDILQGGVSEKIYSGISSASGKTPEQVKFALGFNQMFGEELANAAPTPMNLFYSAGTSDIKHGADKPIEAGVNLAIGAVFGYGWGKLESGMTFARATAAPLAERSGAVRVIDTVAGVAIRHTPKVLGGLYAVDVAARSTDGFTEFKPGSITAKGTPILTYETLPMAVGFTGGKYVSDQRLISRAATWPVRYIDTQYSIQRLGAPSGARRPWGNEDAVLGGGSRRVGNTPQETITRPEIKTLDIRDIVDLETGKAKVVERPPWVLTPAERAMVITQYGLTPQEITFARQKGASLNDILQMRQMTAYNAVVQMPEVAGYLPAQQEAVLDVRPAPQKSILTFDLRSLQLPATESIYGLDTLQLQKSGTRTVTREISIPAILSIPRTLTRTRTKTEEDYAAVIKTLQKDLQITSPLQTSLQTEMQTTMQKQDSDLVLVPKLLSISKLASTQSTKEREDRIYKNIYVPAGKGGKYTGDLPFDVTKGFGWKIPVPPKTPELPVFGGGGGGGGYRKGSRAYVETLGFATKTRNPFAAPAKPAKKAKKPTAPAERYFRAAGKKMKSVVVRRKK